MEIYESKNVLPKDGEAYYFPSFFSIADSNRLFNLLLQEINWKQEQIRIYGKSIYIPRLTAWYGLRSYTYSGIEMPANAFTPDLLYIKNKVEELVGRKFTNVLLNLYRDGKDSVSWHRDNEAELGINPVIASVSLGEPRSFKLRHVIETSLKTQILLNHGSLLIMKGTTQHYWEHSIPKTSKQIGARINLTFRSVL